MRRTLLGLVVGCAAMVLPQAEAVGGGCVRGGVSVTWSTGSAHVRQTYAHRPSYDYRRGHGRHGHYRHYPRHYPKHGHGSGYGRSYDCVSRGPTTYRRTTRVYAHPRYYSGYGGYGSRHYRSGSHEVYRSPYPRERYVVVSPPSRLGGEVQTYSNGRNSSAGFRAYQREVRAGADRVDLAGGGEPDARSGSGEPVREQRAAPIVVVRDAEERVSAGGGWSLLGRGQAERAQVAFQRAMESEEGDALALARAGLGLSAAAAGSYPTAAWALAGAIERDAGVLASAEVGSLEDLTLRRVAADVRGEGGAGLALGERWFLVACLEAARGRLELAALE